MKINTFNGFLMSRDIVLAEIKNGELSKIIKEDLMPIYLARTKNISHWLEKRSIDEHRTNSRLLKKALRLEQKDDVSTALAVHGVTITDNYWVKPEDSELTWEDVRFKENYFSELALHGDLSAFSQNPSRTPELTNTGSFEKCWKLEDGKWWLYKKANKNELFSELFIYHLGKELGFNMAHYEPADSCIKSLDFTEGAKVNFEPAYSWMGEVEDNVLNYKALEHYGAAFCDNYVELLLLDSYCLNADRHTFNFGVLRDVETGKVLCLAPNYDNNIALVYNGYKTYARKPDMFGRDLHTLEKETGAISKYISRNPLPVVTEEMIDRAIDATGMNIDRAYIHQFVKVGYEQTPVYDFVSKKLDTKILNAEQQKKKSSPNKLKEKEQEI